MFIELHLCPTVVFDLYGLFVVSHKKKEIEQISLLTLCLLRLGPIAGCMS